MLRFIGVETSEFLELDENSRYLEVCCTRVPMVFFVSIFTSWCKLRPMCHTLHSFLQVLVKVLLLLWQLDYFSKRLRGTLLSVPRHCPHLCVAGTDSTHHRAYTQPLSRWKLVHCQFFHQIIILQIIFKTLELYNVCSLCYKELQKIDTLLNTKKQNYCSWSGFLHVICAQGTWGENEKIEGSVQGACRVRTALRLGKDFPTK